MQSSSQPRILIYSQDGLGLGHLRRTHSIASEIIRACPSASILSLCDSPLGSFFQAGQNRDYLKLPSIIKVAAGEWRATSLALPFADTLAMRRDLIRSTVLTFQPHIFLVDHMPHGAMGELLPALDAIRSGNLDTRIVLGLRDILDAPEVVQRCWEIEGAYAAVERYYDQVLVYGMRELFDLAEQYAFSQAVIDRLHYCGYVCTPQVARSAARIRSQHLSGSRRHDRLIVALAGGGADAYPMMRTLLDAMPAVQPVQPSVLLLVTGPFMPADLSCDLAVRARGLPVRVIQSVSDPISYIDAADLVIGMAGYNTSTEILRSGQRAILIPRAGPSAEQRTRARLFAAEGWVTVIDPEELSAATVAQEVTRSLAHEPRLIPHMQPNLRGLSSAAERLIALLPAPIEAINAREVGRDPISAHRTPSPPSRLTVQRRPLVSQRLDQALTEL